MSSGPSKSRKAVFDVAATADTRWVVSQLRILKEQHGAVFWFDKDARKLTVYGGHEQEVKQCLGEVLRAVTPATPRIQCSICKAVFRSIAALEQHTQARHGQEEDHLKRACDFIKVQLVLSRKGLPLSAIEIMLQQTNTMKEALEVVLKRHLSLERFVAAQSSIFHVTKDEARVKVHKRLLPGKKWTKIDTESALECLFDIFGPESMRDGSYLLVEHVEAMFLQKHKGLYDSLLAVFGNLVMFSMSFPLDLECDGLHVRKRKFPNLTQEQCLRVREVVLKAATMEQERQAKKGKSWNGLLKAKKAARLLQRTDEVLFRSLEQEYESLQKFLVKAFPQEFRVVSEHKIVVKEKEPRRSVPKQPRKVRVKVEKTDEAKNKPVHDAVVQPKTSERTSLPQRPVVTFVQDEWRCICISCSEDVTVHKCRTTVLSVTYRHGRDVEGLGVVVAHESITATKLDLLAGLHKTASELRDFSNPNMFLAHLRTVVAPTTLALIDNRRMSLTNVVEFLDLQNKRGGVMKFLVRFFKKPLKDEWKKLVTYPVPYFPGQVHIALSEEQGSSLLTQFLAGNNVNSMLFGVDCEWKPEFKARSSKIELIQIASEDTCLLLRVGLWTKPCQELLDFFSKPYVKLMKGPAGKNGDFDKLDAFGIRERNGIIDIGSRPELNVSLKKAVTRVLKWNLDKSQTMSNWGARTYTAEQIRYAATDAWINVVLWKKVSKL